MSTESAPHVIPNNLLTKEELIEKFGWEEYLIFALMLLVSALIGIFFWWKGQKDNAAFLLGGRDMGTLPMTMSLIASFMSAITLLGTPAEVYRYGTQYITLVLSYPIVIGATVTLYLPVFYKLGVSTSYEYLEWRFNRACRVLGAMCFTIQMVLYMAIVVYAPALALSQITGFDVDLACIIIFLVCIFYTAVGGIKAVMWTDTFQTVVMFGSFLAVIIKGNYDVGGARTVFDVNYQKMRIELFNFDFDITTRHTLWGTIIGGYFMWVSIYGINQTQVQRYLTVKTKKMAVTALWWNVLGIGSLLLMCAYAGMVMFAYYDINACDPVNSGLVAKPDQLLPLFVMQVMGDIPCIPGLFVAGVFSGALSTVSSGLNSLAAVTLQDFIMGPCGAKLSENFKSWLTKGFAVGYGLISFGVVFIVKYLPGVLQAALGIFGIVGGPVLGCFTLGMFFPWANGIGGFVGMLSSLIFTMWFGFGQSYAVNCGTYKVPPLPTLISGCPSEWYNVTYGISTTTTTTMAPDEDPNTCEDFTHLKIYEISYLWNAGIATLFCFVVGAVVSLAYKPQNPRKLNRDLISPGLPKLFKFWPRYVRNYFEELYISIGSEYIESKAHLTLKKSQIMGVAPSQMLLQPPEEIGEVNFAFQLESRKKSGEKTHL